MNPRRPASQPTRLSPSTLTPPAGGSPPTECDAENTLVRKNPRARTQACPQTTTKPQSGLVPTFGAGPRAKQMLLRVAQEESGLTSSSPGALSREDPFPAHCGSQAQGGSSRSISAATGAWGDAGRPGPATPEPGPGAPRRSPSSET